MIFAHTLALRIAQRTQNELETLHTLMYCAHNTSLEKEQNYFANRAGKRADIISTMLAELARIINDSPQLLTMKRHQKVQDAVKEIDDELNTLHAITEIRLRADVPYALDTNIMAVQLKTSFSFIEDACVRERRASNRMKRPAHT